MAAKRTFRVDRRDLEVGARHEMEHTKNPTVARRIARDHLREHPTYYQVLPMAEHMMETKEKGMKPIRRKRRQPLPRDTGFPPGFTSTPWG